MYFKYKKQKSHKIGRSKTQEGFVAVEQDPGPIKDI